MGTFLAKILQWQINYLYKVNIILQLIDLCHYFGFYFSFSILSDGFQSFPVYSPFLYSGSGDMRIEGKVFLKATGSKASMTRLIKKLSQQLEILTLS